MSRSRKPIGVGNRSYQAEVAASLVASLGVQDAIEFCIANGWTGTVNLIIKGE